MSKILRDYVTLNEKYFSLYREYEKIKNSKISNNKNLKENESKNFQEVNEYKIKFENLSNQFNEFKIQNEKLIKQFDEKQNELTTQLNEKKNLLLLKKEMLQHHGVKMFLLKQMKALKLINMRLVK